MDRLATQIRESGITFGIEIEATGISRRDAAEAIRRVVGGTVTFEGGAYDAWHVEDAQGRVWKAVRDASVTGAYGGSMAEVVSPVLVYDDIETLQAVVRSLREANGRPDESCGVHVHIGAAPLGAKGVANLVKLVAKQEVLIHKALGIAERRLARWCRPIEDDFLAKLQRAPRTLDELNVAWYGRRNTCPDHYDPSRYHGVNLHNVWFRGTVEFRWFDGTLHAGKIKAYGSNLDRQQMRRRCPGARAVGPAWLPGHQLAFAGYSASWGGGVGTVIPSPGEVVPGLLYEVGAEDLRTLDAFEGHPG